MNEELINAINTIRGECRKHMLCTQCPMYRYCGDYLCGENDPSRWIDPNEYTSEDEWEDEE